jgi:hypothetical protein
MLKAILQLVLALIQLALAIGATVPVVIGLVGLAGVVVVLAAVILGVVFIGAFFYACVVAVL